MAETVTIGLRDAAIAQREQNEEWNRALDEARKATQAVRRATGGPQMAFWLTGNADPLFLDFERERERQSQRAFGGGRASGAGGGGASF